MTQDDRMETITAETDNPTVCITHGRFIPCRNEDWHHFTDNPYWVKLVRDFQGSDDLNLTWEPATLTITDPAEIRATDEPDEITTARYRALMATPLDGPMMRGETTPAPASGAAVALDLDAIEARVNAATPGPWWVEQVGDFGDKSAVIECVRWRGYLNTLHLGEDTPTAEFIAHAREDVPALVAEVRRLTARSLAAESVILDQRRMSADHDAFCRPATDRLVARAEAAEAEVVTLRAKVAAAEALADQWADRKRSDGMSGNAWIGITLAGVAADLRAALAVTTGEGQ